LLNIDGLRRSVNLGLRLAVDLLRLSVNLLRLSAISRRRGEDLSLLRLLLLDIHGVAIGVYCIGLLSSHRGTGNVDLLSRLRGDLICCLLDNLLHGRNTKAMGNDSHYSSHVAALNRDCHGSSHGKGGNGMLD